MGSLSFFLGIFLISFSTLVLEISLTRLLSVAQGYHFAFLVVSMALLGYGASGSFLYSFPQILSPDPEKKLIWSSWLFSLSTWVAYTLSNLLPFDWARLYLDHRQIFYIFLYYLFFSLPFFFSGLTISTAFSLRSSLSGKIYFADLMGASCGCLLALLLFGLWGGPGTLLFSAFSAAWAAIIFSRKIKINLTFNLSKWIWLLTLFIFLFWPPSFLDLRLSPYKPLPAALFFPGARLLETYWNAFSRVDLLESPAARTAPGLSLIYGESLPRQIGLTIDGERLNPITHFEGEEGKEGLSFIEFLPSSFPYKLSQRERVLILEPMGGLEVLVALYHQSRQIVALELNPLLVSILKGKYRQFSGGIYDHPRVKVVIGDPRSYVRSHPQPFDLIVLSLTESWATSSGISSLHEDYRLTKEAIQDYLKILTPQGAMSLSLYINPPPRAELRLVSLVKEALQKMGKDPKEHLLIFRTWGTFNLLLKKNPIQIGETQALQAFGEKLLFDLVYYPGITAEKANIYNRFPTPVYFLGVQKVLRGEGNFLETYPFDLSPPSDEKPFFHHYFKWKYIRETYQFAGQKWQIFIEGGYLVFLVLFLSIFFTLLFIILPWAYKLERNKVLPPSPYFKIYVLFYFSFLGLGFMFVEISLIQRFILFLGHPVYSVSLVIFSLLIFASLGSRFFPKLSKKNLGNGSIIFSLLVILLLLYASLLPSLLRFFQGEALLSRQILTTLLISFPAFFMGMPFPLGVRSLGEKAPELIPLGWCANGCSSVLGAILPVIIALAWGFQTVFVLAALIYELSFLTWRKIS